MFESKKFLITGGTGSFGTTVTNALRRTDCAEIRIFSRDEKKQDELRRELADDRVSFYLGDVRDVRTVQSAMQGVNYVFHAAALKQVPSCEFFPVEAVKTNILGTSNVIDEAVRAGVERLVCLSTDKAAYPVNAMGISKAMMERVFMAKSRSNEAKGTVISGTRYGNVIASRGSVVPLFISQCLAGKPLTVTDPTMTRFLMSLDDAVSLVMYAFNNADPGDLMIQKASAARVGDLAEAVRSLVNPDCPIQNIGARHGEKLHEVLMTREEAVRAIEAGDYYRVVADNRDLNYGKYLDEGSIDVARASEYSSDSTKLLTVDEIKHVLLAVPEVQAAIGAGRVAN